MPQIAFSLENIFNGYTLYLEQIICQEQSEADATLNALRNSAPLVRYGLRLFSEDGAGVPLARSRPLTPRR